MSLKDYKEFTEDPKITKEELEESNSSSSEKYIYNLPDMNETNDRVVFKLWIAIFLCFGLMAVEVLGGLLADSLAILTDAAHMFSDISGFFISIFSLWLSRRPSTKKLSFGYHRAEVIGTLASMILIWGITIWLVAEAISRIINPEYKLERWYMLGTAIFGLCSNLLLGKVLHSGGHHGHGHNHNHGDHDHNHGQENEDNNEDEHAHDDHKHDHDHKEHNHDHDHDHEDHHNHEHNNHNHDGHNHNHEILNHNHEEHQHKHFDIEQPHKSHKKKNLSALSEHENVNLRAAMIHIIGDIIQSIGVLIASIIIFFWPEYKIVDPICTFIFAILVIFTTIPVMKECMIVLMEGAPVGIVINEFEDSLKQIEGVIEVHDLHIWSLSVGKPSLSCHIYSSNPNYVLKEATKLCREYGIFHSTIQIEDTKTKEHPLFMNCEQNLHQKKFEKF